MKSIKERMQHFFDTQLLTQKMLVEKYGKPVHELPYAEGYIDATETGMLVLQELDEPKPRIEVRIEKPYGTETAYPACNTAHLFCLLLDQSTLTKGNIAVLKQLGYEIVVKEVNL